MAINTDMPVSNQVMGLESAPKVNEVNREDEKSTGQQTAQAEENPDYRVNLSEASRQRLSELENPLAADQNMESGGLSEQEAEEMAQNTAAQLSQTNVPIANQAMQKAVDLTS